MTFIDCRRGTRYERERRAGFESAGILRCDRINSVRSNNACCPPSRCVSRQDQSGMGAVPLPTYETRPPSWWCFRWACIARERESGKGWFGVGVTDARGRRGESMWSVDGTWLLKRVIPCLCMCACMCTWNRIRG